MGRSVSSAFAGFVSRRRELFTVGREAYDNLDFDVAITALTQAEEFYFAHPSVVRPELLAEVFVFLGASQLHNGDKVAASKQFGRALQMNPTLAPDSKYFGVEVQTAISSARKQLVHLPKGTLMVESFPAGADVEGVSQSYGMTPVSNIELAEGRHLILLSRPGFAPTAALPEVISGRANLVRSILEASPELIAVRQKAENLISRQTFDNNLLPPTALEVALTMKSRFLVMVAVTGASKTQPAVELQVWNANTGHRLAAVKFDVDSAGRGYQAGAEAIKAWIARPPSAIATAKKPLAPSLGEPVYKRWWFWTAVGAVAAGGVAVGVVAAQSRGSGGFNVVLGQP